VTDALPLSQPDITEAEIRAVVETLRSGRLALGPRLEAFERLVAQRVKRQYGIGVNSGTSGLHLCLAALGVGPGDEVITPAFSFVASANCVLHVGATPVFVDCDPRTLNVLPRSVESRITEKTKAIIGVEVFGNPAGMAELAALAGKYEIPLVEDCSEALGGRVRDEPVGSFGRLAVFGFYPNKQITTGEGGMVLTDDDRLAELCRSMRNQGRSPEIVEAGQGLGSWLSHERMGFNFRMSEINAALGLAQMRRLDQLIEARQRVAAAYTRRLRGNTELILPTVEPDTFMSWFVYVVRLSDRFSEDDRDYIIKGLRRHDVGASDFPVAESVAHRTVALPFFTRLTEREVDLVCQTLELMITRVTFSRT
jgi:perosamine synthetase